MSPKPPSKQKRAAQNRARRAAHAARIANAQAAATSSGRSETSSGQRGGGSLLGRVLGRSGGGSGGRLATARADGAARRGDQPVGYRAALSALLAAVAAAIVCAVALRYPVDAEGELYTREHLVADWSLTALDAAADDPGGDVSEIAGSIDEWAPGRAQETVAKALWPFSLAIVLPIVGSGLGFHAVRRRAASKVVNRALYATLFGAVLTQGLLLLFLPTVIAMGVAMFQVRKAETIAAAEAAGPEDATDVDDDDLDDDDLDDDDLDGDDDLDDDDLDDDEDDDDRGDRGR